MMINQCNQLIQQKHMLMEPAKIYKKEGSKWNNLKKRAKK